MGKKHTAAPTLYTLNPKIHVVYYTASPGITTDNTIPHPVFTPVKKHTTDLEVIRSNIL